MNSPPREGIVEACVDNLNGAPHRSEIRRLILLRLPMALEKVNGVNAVFLQEPISIYQHLSAKGVITI